MNEGLTKHADQSHIGRLKPTNFEDLYLLSGIVPHGFRRDVCVRVEILKQSTKETHSLFGQIPSTNRPKSRHCFLSSVQPQTSQQKLLNAANGGRDFAINRPYSQRRAGIRGQTGPGC